MSDKCAWKWACPGFSRAKYILGFVAPDHADDLKDLRSGAWAKEVIHLYRCESYPDIAADQAFHILADELRDRFNEGSL